MHTVIVGGGIAGIKAAREISRRGLGKVTLVSQNSEFIYHSMLYAAATGRLPDDTVMLEDVFADDKNVTIAKGTLEEVEAARKQIVCSGITYTYDTLVLAIGTSTNYFAVPGADHYSFSIDTLQKATELQRHIHDDIAVGHHLDKRYVIVGGGLTGVELAGALGAYIRKVAMSHGLTKSDVRVLLVEREDRLLPMCSKTASKKAASRLKKLGVDVRLAQHVDSLTGAHIVIDGKKVSTETVIWTCGSRGNELFSQYRHLFKTTDDGHVIVNSHLRAHDDIYVIGDSAAVPYGGRISPARREALYLARNLDRKMRKLPARSYNPRRSATCIRIGDKWAYVEKYGVYAAGKTGFILLHLYERFMLESLLSPRSSSQVLRDSTKLITGCDLCDV